MSEGPARRGRIGTTVAALIALGAIAAIVQLARTRAARFASESPEAVRAANPATYASPAMGLSIALPDGMTVDRRLEPIVTEIADATTRVQLFRQDLPTATFAQYVNYKARPVHAGGDPVVLLFERDASNGSLPFHEMRWTRRELREVPSDRRHYAAIDFRLGEHEVASVQIDTADDAWIARHLDAAIASFRAFPPTQTARPQPFAAEPRAAPLTPEARATLDRLFGGERQSWGIYEPGTPQSLDTLLEIERWLDYRFGVLLVYTGLGDADVGDQLEAAWRAGRLVELTLQVPREASPTSAPVYDVLAGEREQEIRSYARAVAQFGHPVLFRLDNEMNGDWVK